MNGDVIAGDFFILADGEDGEFRGLTNMEAAEMVERFARPEEISNDEVQDNIVIFFTPYNIF